VHTERILRPSLSPIALLAALAGCAAPSTPAPAVRTVSAPASQAARPFPAAMRSSPTAAAPEARPWVGPDDDAPEEPVLDGTLEGYRARAVEANPGVQAAFERWRAAAERGAQTGALPDPRLTWRYFIEEVETRVGPQEQALGLSQTLPWPGRLRLREELADAEAEATRARYTARVAEVLRAVDEAWYDAYYLERAIAVVRRNRDLFGLLEEVLQRRYATGEAAFADLIRAQVELGRLEDRLRTLEDQRRPLAARLNATLDRASDAPLTWPAQLDVRTLEASDARVLEWVCASSPELVAAAHEIEREERSSELARMESRPDLTLGLEWIDTGDARTSGVDDSGKDPWIASLSLDLPVWGGRTRAAEEEARARRRAATLAREQVARGLESEVEGALYRLRDAGRRVELYGDTLLSRARQSFEAIEAAFRGGEASFLELVDAERTLLEMELALERARTDRAQAISHLERLAGRPLESLRFDPAETERGA
jgi:outer membrane protein TolC